MPPVSDNKQNEKADTKYWKSLDELEQSPEFKTFVEREFPEGAAELTDPVNRRNFLKFMGASLALAGAAGCDVFRRPEQNIFPYAKMPEYVIPGTSTYYATATHIGDEVTGLLVESHEGRPTKIEGNPGHPANKGATKAYHQASILDLYDPDRVQVPQHKGNSSSWNDFDAWFQQIQHEFQENGGEGLGLLTEQQASPTFYRLLSLLKKKLPKARVFKYSPLNRDNSIQGLHGVTGQWLTPDYDFEKANVVVAFDADFLVNDPGSISHSRAFTKRRDPEHKLGMNRLYVFENNFSMTGGLADHRIRLKYSQIEKAVCVVAQQLAKKGILQLSADISKVVSNKAQQAHGIIPEAYLNAIVDDIAKNKGKTVLLAGPKQSAFVHGLVCLINKGLGNNGSTVMYRALNFAEHDLVTSTHGESIAALAGALSAGKVNTLFILGGDPIFTVPPNVRLGEYITKAKHIVHITSLRNATSAKSNWVVPQAHYLESWGDVKALDGTVSITQPLISPLYNGKSPIEILGRLSGSSRNGYEMVRETLPSTEKIWKRWLHEGIVSGPEKPVTSITLNAARLITQSKQHLAQKAHKGIELVFHQDPSIYDGRYINNAWLQELPDPITKMTWDNAATMSPTTARELDVRFGDIIQITSNGHEQEIAVLPVPGHADNSLSLTMGYGQKETGRIGAGTGFDVYKLRTSENSSASFNATIKKTNKTYKLASTQDHWSIEGRPMYQEAALEDYKKHPTFAKDAVEVPHRRSISREVKYDKGYQWGMNIDLSKCTGCNACVVGCQSENNIPVVGKKEVLNGREMHWIRIDRYFSGTEDEPEMVQQPVTCLQCELAPCEVVCPVAATNHTDQGLNDMTYNRCIGTRYCANNCPVKVRRFNFFDYHQRNQTSVKKDRKHFFDHIREPAKTVQMQFNPDVTVRMRGVMEKCTYCVQRINEARITAHNDGREIRDGEITTACQQTCPTEAIVFGNINDPDSKVSRIKKKFQNYNVLEELNLKQRTSYIANVTNPHPLLKKKIITGGQHA